MSTDTPPTTRNQADSRRGGPPSGDALLNCEDVSKSFGSVRALADVSIWAHRGEVTALVGDNGAGKSTLVRCIAGVHRPDGGRIVFDGAKTNFHSPEDARRAGMETVHQTLALVPELTVWQNLFLNRERVRRFGPVAFLDRKGMQAESRTMLSRLAVNVPSARSRVGRLSGGQRQAVAISRAAGWGSKLVIMDEPTAALGVQETAKVEELIRTLHALVWVGGWTEADVRRAVEATAAAGFDLLEIPVLDPTTVDAGLTRRLLGEYGLKAACSLGLSFDADISSPDPDVARRGRGLLAAALDVTRDIGATYLGGVIYSALGKYPGPATPQGRRHCVESLAWLADRAAADGITLGVEVVNRYESNLLNTAEQAMALLDEVDAANLVVHLATSAPAPSTSSSSSPRSAPSATRESSPSRASRPRW